MSIYICEVCKKEIRERPSHFRRFCSRSCKAKSPDAIEVGRWLGKTFAKTRPTTKGYKFSNESKEKMRKAKLGTKQSVVTIQKKISSLLKTSEKRKDWKGESVGYYGLHNRVYVRLGKPKYCEFCGLNDKNKRYEWANKSHTYKKDLSDWIRLCVSCHRKYDYQYRKSGSESCQFLQ